MKAPTGLLLLAGTLGGFFLGTSWRPDSQAAAQLDGAAPDPGAPGAGPNHGDEQGEPGSPTQLALPAAEPGLAAASTSPPAQRAAAAARTFSDGLLEHHDREFLAGWGKVRTDGPDAPTAKIGLEQFQGEVLSLSMQLGKKAASALDRAEALQASLASNDGAQLLAAWGASDWAPDWKYLASEAFDIVTATRSSSASQLGSTFIQNSGNSLTEGITLTFGPGVHTLDARSFRDATGNHIPRDVTVLGAGRDQTLLQMGDLGSRSNIERLSFRNITLDAQNDGLFDHRSGSATLNFNNARIIRFDAGHSGCYIFSSRGGAMINATNLELIGGYGSAPGNGGLLRSDPFAGRFRNCRFELVELRSLQRLRSGLVSFEGCSFALREADPRIGANPATTKFTGCSYAHIEGNSQDLAKSLEDLFPGAE